MARTAGYRPRGASHTTTTVCVMLLLVAGLCTAGVAALPEHVEHGLAGIDAGHGHAGTHGRDSVAERLWALGMAGHCIAHDCCALATKNGTRKVSLDRTAMTVALVQPPVDRAMVATPQACDDSTGPPGRNGLSANSAPLRS